MSEFGVDLAPFTEINYYWSLIDNVVSTREFAGNLHALLLHPATDLISEREREIVYVPVLKGRERIESEERYYRRGVVFTSKHSKLYRANLFYMAVCWNDEECLV